MIEKKDKGLADAQEGEFILNETGTSVSTDQVEGVDIPEPSEELDEKEQKLSDAEAETGE